MSHFQNLPHLISSQIFKYFLNNMRMPGRDAMKLLGPLLWSCHNWRSIAICHLFEKQEINFDKGFISADTCNWPEDLDLPLPLVSGLAKILVLNIKFPNSFRFERDYQDRVLENLPPSMIYSNALSVTAQIKFTGFYPKISIEESYIQMTLKILLQYLKCAVPNVRDLEIHNFLSSFLHYGINLFKHIALVMRSLIANVAKRKLSICQNSIHFHVELGDICSLQPLTHLHVERQGRDCVPELIHKCAESLQVLSIDGMARTTLPDIIKDENGNYVVYPNLKQLVIHRWVRYSIDMRVSSFPGAVPFPNLQRFSCSDLYPFGDDVVFRGNQRTLQVIDLRLDQDSIEILICNNVFSATSHPNLQRAKVFLESTKEVEFVSKDFAKLVYDIGKNSLDFALGIENRNCIKPQHFISFQLLGQIQLRRLDFGMYEIGIIDIIQTLESLPNLVELSTCFRRRDISCQSNRYKRHIQSLVDKHYPLAPKLQTLGVNENGYILETIFAVIIMCPNAGRLRLCKSIEFESFKYGLRYCSLHSEMSEYAVRLEEIKFNTLT